MSKLDNLRIDSAVPRPRRRRQFQWVPLVVVLFIAALLLYFNRDMLFEKLQLAQSPPDLAESAAEATTEVVPASRGPQGSVSAAGYLEIVPPGPETVSSLVSGMLAEVNAIPGQAVHKGDVLARLDSSNLQQRASVLGTRVELAQRQLELKQAGFRNEEILQAQAAVDNARAGWELANSRLERSAQLYASGVISRQEYDNDETALSQAQAAVDTAQARLGLLQAGTRNEELRIAEAELAAARAELQQLHWEISQCTIRAPHDGVVLEQLARSGDWLQPGTDNPVSAAVLSIFDPSRVQAWVDVNQRDSGSLFVGQPVEMTTDAHPQRIVNGVVSRIMPVANLQKNTVQAKISIDEVPPDFLPELSVKVTFLPPEAASVDTDSEGGAA